MNHDEHDDLWRLLGKAREPKNSPFFASKVLRAIREEPKPLGFWQWLRQSWLLPSAATATAAIAVVLALQHPTNPGSPNPIGSIASADPLSGLIDAMSEQGDLATPLPNLLATEDNSVWLQADPSSLLP